MMRGKTIASALILNLSTNVVMRMVIMGTFTIANKAMSILVFGQGKHRLLMKFVKNVLNQYKN